MSIESGAIKFTTDGRKVLVVGKLNAQEHIVQEIFVSSGQEIPSGENFVVKGLHDAPAESWKDQDLRKREARYAKRCAEIERQEQEQDRRNSEAQQKAKHRAAALLEFARNSDEPQLQRLHALLAGEITHFFVSRYRPQIVTWDDEIIFDSDRNYGRLSIEGIKLLSLFGRSDGRLDYRLNQYRDGSGSSSIEIVPCRSYAEALSEAQKQLDAEAAMYVAGTRGYIDLAPWQTIAGIVIPPDALAKHQAAQRAHRTERIAKLRAEIAQIEAQS